MRLLKDIKALVKWLFSGVEPCPTCNGTGEFYEYPCGYCNGTGET